MLAAVAGCLMSVCIAFAGTVDIATNFFGLVVTVIAKGLLNAADIVLEPLLEITTMSTADVSRFVPGFDSGNNIGNFFIQAINIIAYMIAGVLICCHIISYLINLAHGEKVESIPKLIWNAVFGIVMVICGKTFLTMIFNEIVAPLSSALTEGVSDAGGTFSFSSVGSDMTGLGEITSAFDLNSLATLIVVLALMLIIWWNLIKLVLECAERYIICIFTINLSPLAFATMASENTKDTARSWLQMFWSQCVLLILNIWVVGIARTALNNGLFGASNTEMVKWGLITYAFLKIAQRLDDMMQTAGLKITRTTGLDPISEASGVLRSIGNVFGGVASVAGHVAGVGKNMWDAGKNIGKANGIEPIKSFADFMNGGETSAQDGGYVNNASMADKMKADAVLGKETMYDRADKMASGALNADSYNTDAYKQVLEDKLRSAGHIDDDAHVESVKIGEDGKLLASAVKRDEKNRVSEKSEFEIGDTQEGLLDVNGAKKYDSMQVAPNGKSVMEEDSAMGKFGLRKVGEDAAGNQIWEAEQSVNMFGDKVKDVTPDANNKVQFTIPASEIAKGRKAGDSDAMTAYKHFNANDDNDAFKNSIRDALSAETGSAALNKARENEEEQAAMATRIGMTDKERLADMMNPDSNADYNSPNAFKAMEDHIKENAQYYPAQAAMLADGWHVTGMHVSDGTDGNPAGSLIVAIGNDQDGKNSQATCTFTRDEEPVPETAETPAAQTNEQPVKDTDAAAPAPVSEDAPAPVGEEASAPAPQSVDETATTPAAETAQAPVPQDMDSKVDAPAPVGEEAPTPAPQDVGGKADAPVPASENASAPATQSADGKVAEPTSAGGATPAPGVTAPTAAPAQNPTTSTVNAPVQGTAPVSGGTVPGTANTPKTANVPGMAANNMPASTAPETAATPATQITPETASAPSESNAPSAGGHATAPNEGTAHSESSGTGSVSNVPGADGTDTLGRSDSAPTSTNGQESGSAPAQGSGGTTSPATADTTSAVPESAPAESATTTNVATPAPASDTGSSEPSGDSGSSSDNSAGCSSGSAPASGESAHAPSGSGSSGSGTSVSAPTSSGDTGSSSESAPSGSVNDSTDTPTSETAGTSSEKVEAPAADGLPYAVGETGGSGYSEGDMPPEPETTVETETAATEVVQVEQAAEQQSGGSTVTETVDEAGSESNTQNSHDDSENYSGGQNTDTDDVPEPDFADEPDTQDETEDTEFDATDDAAFDVPIADGSEYYEDKAQTNSFTAPEQEMAEPEPVAEPESEPEQVAEQKRPPIPEAYMTSQSSVTRLSSTNGTVESDSLGMFQMTREEVADNGWTTWRILQKVDSDGSVPEYAPFVVHIKPVWDPATRTSRPATFDEVANKARSIEGFENVGPDLDADYRRSQARQESSKNSEPRPYNGHSNGQPHFQRYDDQKRDSHGHGKQDKRHNPFSGMGDYKRRR